MLSHSDASSPTRPRLVILGASNVTRSISIAVETARLALGTPLDLFLAIGHGRSYGMESKVLGRALPAIIDCGLWGALHTPSLTGRGLGGGSNHSTHSFDSPTPFPPPSEGGGTFAILTDIGNDILYNAATPVIAEWIDECVERLLAGGARIVMTELPMASIAALTPRTFVVARSILFPWNRLSLQTARQRANDLNDRLRTIAQKHAITLVPQPAEWFGFDPIHTRRWRWAEVWQALLVSLSQNEGDVPCARGSLARWLQLKRLTPERWRLLGVPLGRPQPAGTLADDSTISIF